MKSSQPRWALTLAAAFAIFWIFHRAHQQSITLDEADTWHLWVRPAWPSHWEPHSNNHVLNSALMRLSLHFFPLSELAVRAPALAGGILYIGSSFALASLLFASTLLQWGMFTCLVFNPFIADYLVAARGYALALGCLTLAIFLLALAVIRNRRSVPIVAAISVSLALSFAANFTFAYAAAFIGLCTLLLIVRSRQTAFAAVVPGLATALVLVGSIVARFPRDQLFWGTSSIRESWDSIRDSSFTEINPFLVNPSVAHWLDLARRHLAAAIVVWLVLFLLFAWRDRHLQNKSPAGIFAAAIGLTLAATFAAHYAMFRFARIPLPLERTSLHMVALATVAFGATVSVPTGGRLAKWTQTAGVVILIGTSVLFMAELRDSYFRLWRDGAELKAAFPVLEDVCRRTGEREVIADWNLINSLNFYREATHSEEVDEVQFFEHMPRGRKVYILNPETVKDLIRDDNLQTVWHDADNRMIIAVPAPGQ
ncbi:MAG TPA: hypothetical protein VGL53_23655 [Bryobacteraceae bacterium]|jgi:hypothetical protein